MKTRCETKTRWAKSVLVIGMLMAVSSSSMAFQHPINEVVRSCVKAVKQELFLGNYDVIQPDIGFKHRGRKAYDVYVNLKVREGLEQEASPMKAHCHSEGFGKVRSIVVEEGRWDYRLTSNRRG